MPLLPAFPVTPVTPILSHARPRGDRPGRGASWAPILQSAAQQVAERWGREPGSPTVASAIADLITALVTRGVETQIGTGSVVNESLRSELGRRLLDELRAELVRGWAAGGAPDTELPPLMVAIEEIRDAIQ